MRRFELVGQRRIELKTNVAVPEPMEGQVLVEVKACTVCGRSDLIYYHYLTLRDHCAQGCFGHEISGVIAAVGPGVTKVKSGDRVLIVGHGPVGLLALQTSRLRGASFVMVMDLDPWRLERSIAMSADVACPVNGQSVLALPVLEDSFDVAIDAVGTPATLKRCIDRVRHNGLVILLGTHHVDTHVSLDLVQWEKKSLRVHSSAEPDDDARRSALRTAERLAASGAIQLAPLFF